MRFQREFQKKPPAKKRQLSQNVTVFLQGTSCFFSYFLTKKRGKGEISDRNSGKTTRKKTENFRKRNGFYEGDIVFYVFLTKKRAKSEMTEYQEKEQWKKMTIFTKRNGFYPRYIVFF